MQRFTPHHFRASLLALLLIFVPSVGSLTVFAGEPAVVTPESLCVKTLRLDYIFSGTDKTQEIAAVAGVIRVRAI